MSEKTVAQIAKEVIESGLKVKNQEFFHKSSHIWTRYHLTDVAIPEASTVDVYFFWDQSALLHCEPQGTVTTYLVGNTELHLNNAIDDIFSKVAKKRRAAK